MANVTVTFGDDTKSNDAITAAWIKHAMDVLATAGRAVCGSVHIQGGGLDVGLPVGACPPGGSARRPPNAAERDVIDRWRRHRLDQGRVSPGELEAFVRQMLRL